MRRQETVEEEKKNACENKDDDEEVEDEPICFPAVIFSPFCNAANRRIIEKLAAKLHLEAIEWNQAIEMSTDRLANHFFIVDHPKNVPIETIGSNRLDDFLHFCLRLGEANRSILYASRFEELASDIVQKMKQGDAKPKKLASDLRDRTNDVGQWLYGIIHREFIENEKRMPDQLLLLGPTYATVTTFCGYFALKKCLTTQQGVPKPDQYKFEEVLIFEHELEELNTQNQICFERNRVEYIKRLIKQATSLKAEEVKKDKKRYQATISTQTYDSEATNLGSEDEEDEYLGDDSDEDSDEDEVDDKNDPEYLPP